MYASLKTGNLNYWPKTCARMEGAFSGEILDLFDVTMTGILWRDPLDQARLR